MSTIVYTKPDCGQCDATKRWLDMYGVPYETEDVTKNPLALERVRELGYLEMPVVESKIHGHWSGFRIERLKVLRGPKA